MTRTISAIVFPLVLAGLCSAVRAQVEWTAADLLKPRSDHAMAFDSARGRLVVFGGDDGSTQVGDTWEWDGTRWQNRSPALSPPARQGHAMAYDAARNRVVLFGGVAGIGLSDTWEWDGNSWTKRNPATVPSFRSGHTMAYDAARNRVVMFGGNFNLAETWEWDGSNWRLAAPVNSPPGRTEAAIAYDAARQRVVLFGGRSIFPLLTFQDTWEWDGSNWVQVTTGSAPGARYDHAMAFDAVRNRVVLSAGFTGIGPGAPFLVEDLWEFDGASWVDVTPGSGPAARGNHQAVWDAAQARVLICGGVTTDGILADSWSWDGSQWSLTAASPAPAPRIEAAMAYDAGRGRTVMFGGVPASRTEELGDTWEWDGTAWVQHVPATVPPVRRNAAMAYDRARGTILMFGGGTSTGGTMDYQDTWSWTGSNWALRPTGATPPPRRGHAMVYDEARDVVVLFGGEDQTTSRIHTDTWIWDGFQWTQQFPTNVPPSSGPGMAYDAERQVVVLHDSDRTWEWDGSNWSERTNGGKPGAQDAAGLIWDRARQRAVAFGGQRLLVPIDELWEWDGAQWMQRATASVPDAATYPAVVYDEARSVLVHHGRSGTWEMGPVDPASYQPFGAGCAGSAGTPDLAMAMHDLPWIGDAVQIDVTSLPPGQPTVLFFGDSTSQWGGLGLPLDLGPAGMPGCTLFVSGEVAVPLANVGGVAAFSFTLMPSPALVGVPFHNQAWVMDNVNPIGWIVSNPASGLVGSR